jgi:hypothetical protein
MLPFEVEVVKRREESQTEIRPFEVEVVKHREA